MNKVEFVLGAVFVIINAYERFNTPSAYRSTTTALRYYTAVFMYVAIACITFMILAKSPALLTQIGAGIVPDDVKNLPAPLMSALVLTVLLDKMPFFAPLDRWLRQKLQFIANIPHEARRLSHRLMRADFHVADPMRARIREQMVNSGFRDEDIQFERSESSEYAWTKLTVLFDHLAVWEGQRKFSGFMAEFAEEFKSLKQRYEQLVPKARSCLNHLRDLPQDGCDAKSIAMGHAYKSYFKEQAEALLGELCGFVSRGILQSSVVHDTRGQALRDLGFQDEAGLECSRLSFHQIVSLFAVTATVFLFGTVLASKHAFVSFERQLALVVMVATIYSLAIICALHPKDHWTLAQCGSNGERPTGFYVLAGILAALSSVAVNFLFKVIMFGWSGACNDLAVSYPWLLCSFGTAVATAYLTDNRGDEYGGRQRWVEGALQALGMMAVSYVTYLWLGSTGYFKFRNVDPEPFLLYLMALAAFNGFALGFLVPTWYRRSRCTGAAGKAVQTPDSAGPARRIPLWRLRNTGKTAPVA